MNFLESAINNFKRVKDELTDNVTPENYSHAEVMSHKNHKEQIEQDVLTQKEQDILDTIPTREELEVMKQEHTALQQAEKEKQSFDIAA